MTSFQISLTPSRRAATRFIGGVRRALQKALVDEGKKSGLTQAEVARRIGVHRSIINRELRGVENLSLGRVAELAWAMGRKPILELVESAAPSGANHMAAPIAATDTGQTAARIDANSAVSVTASQGAISA
jgi:hypothetical protein